jgi:hypothetical protein
MKSRRRIAFTKDRDQQTAFRLQQGFAMGGMGCFTSASTFPGNTTKYRQIIHDMLAPADYEITEAENGEEALTAIAKQRPDLILMGINCPSWTATRSRAKSRPIPRREKSNDMTNACVLSEGAFLR